MIHLTRLNNTSITINSDLIKFVEQSPDTVITLLNGEKILVRESAEQILDRIVDFRRRLLAGSGAWHLANASVLLMNPASTGENEG
jgi:flagellar protein FlbD